MMRFPLWLAVLALVGAAASARIEPGPDAAPSPAVDGAGPFASGPLQAYRAQPDAMLWQPLAPAAERRPADR